MRIEKLLKGITLKKHKETFKIPGYEFSFHKQELGWEVHIVQFNSRKSFYYTGDLLNKTLILVPVYLDLPLFINIKNPYILEMEQRIRFYAPIPIGFDFLVSGEDDSFLLTRIFPSLQRAYYGELPNTGKLAYYINVNLFTDPKHSTEGFVFIPMDVYNTPVGPPTLDKILIETERLSLFFWEKFLISEIVQVNVGENGCVTTYTDKPPFENLLEVKKGAIDQKGLFLKGITASPLKSFTRWFNKGK